MTDEARFLLDTTGLFGGSESRLELCTEARLADMEFSEVGLESAVVDGRLEVDLVLERTGADRPPGEADDSQRPGSGAVLASGTVEGRWSAPCRRCLEPTFGELVAEVSELFEMHPTEGETWPLTEAGIDLGPMLREVALLSIPLAPLCRSECEGPAPDRFPTGPAEDEAPAEDEGPAIDPRWSALDELTFDG